MPSVVSASTAPQHLDKLRAWFTAEWAKVDPFEGLHAGFQVPAPLLALDGQTLIGGLAFTSHAVPGRASLGLWINALLVAPDHRRQGIGSQLITAAEYEARRLGIDELFVYTNLPAMYRRLGWVQLDPDGSSSVLRKV